MDTIIPEFLKGYQVLFGDIYSQTMRDNIFAGGRWLQNNRIHSHIKKITAKDDVLFRDVADNLKPTLVDFNTRLEQSLNDKIAQEAYALRIPLPINYQRKETTCGIIECGSEIENYEFFAFGKKALQIQSLEDIHIYR